MSDNVEKTHETLRKHQLNMFWGFLRIFWKSGSRLKNRFSVQMPNNVDKKITLKHPENTN